MQNKASLRELLTLGISGGIVPCPAALVVLLSAVSMNRVGFGLLLIVAFSAGLAAVLVGIGVLMVYARQSMSRFQSEGKWITRWLPITSSAFIVLFGLALTWQALQTTGCGVVSRTRSYTKEVGVLLTDMPVKASKASRTPLNSPLAIDCVAIHESVLMSC